MQHAVPNTSWFSRLLGRRRYGILAGLVISGISVYTAYALDTTTVHLAGKVTFQDEKLTTKLTATSLRQVMEEISKASGVQIRWLDAGGEESVTVDVVALPLSKVIPRLLGERNFLLFYSSTGEGARLTQIWISSRKTSTKQLEGAQQPFAQEPPLPLPSEESAPEEDFVPPDMLLQTALYDLGSAARLEAIARLEGYSHQDPRIPAAFSHLANNDDDRQVREAAAAVLEAIE